MIHVYRSTDAGAPVLNSTAGSLIAVLDACLVNGYGSKPSAGWTKAFSGTNKAAYRMPATDLAGTTDATLQAYLRVDDTALQSAYVRGYETMSDVDTGGYSFPSTDTYWPKSHNTDGAAREWVLFTDGLLFYVFQKYHPSYTYDLGVFGEYLTHRTGDVSPLIVNGYTGSFPWQPLASGFRQINAEGNPVLSRNYVGDATEVPFRSLTGAINSSLLVGGLPDTPYPGLANAGFVAEPYYLQEFSSSKYYLRGVHPGLAMPFERIPDALITGTQFTNVHGAPGRTFELVKVNNASTGFLVDITGPWR